MRTPIAPNCSRWSAPPTGALRLPVVRHLYHHYNLQRAHEHLQMFQDVPTVGLWDGLRCG